MPKFNKRKILRKSLHIFSNTGQVVSLYVRNVPYDPTVNRVPTDLFAGENEPVGNPTEFKKYYILAKFEDTITDKLTVTGKQQQVSGILTVPMMYQKLLAFANYVDPYNNGSLLEKVGKTSSDEQGLFIYQSLSGVVLPKGDF